MPISCHLYDQLEVAAMRKQKVRLRFEPPHSETIFEGVITDLFSRNGEEFFKAKTATGRTRYGRWKVWCPLRYSRTRNKKAGNGTPLQKVTALLNMP